MAEGLHGRDAERYAAGFVHGKSLDLSDEHAAAFASGTLYFWVIANDVLLGRGVLLDFDEYVESTYIEPFEDALAGGASPEEALGLADESFRFNERWWPLAGLGDNPYEGTLAEDYTKAFTETDEVGLAAHQYAAFYAGNRYFGFSEEHSRLAGSVIARAYREADQPNTQLRVKYASAYLLGYQHARQTHEYESEAEVGWWADSYADGYILGWQRATGRRWWDATDLGFYFAELYAHARQDWGFTEQEAFLAGDAYSRGAYHASQIGLSFNESYDYAWEYYLAYYEQSAENGWSEERAHAYSAAYAGERLDGASEDDAHQYAFAYESAFSAARAGGQSIDEAQQTAQAAAGAGAAG